MPIAAFICSTKDVYVEVVAIGEDNEIASFSSSTKDDVRPMLYHSFRWRNLSPCAPSSPLSRSACAVAVCPRKWR
eukprot:296013-Prorocentrum_minimum.AAC.1